MSAPSNEVLKTYKCLVMYDDECVADALTALRDGQGMDWWYLVVDLDAGGYAVAPFTALQDPLQNLGATFLQTPLGALVGTLLLAADKVEQGTISLADARANARAAASKAVIVIQDGEVAGVIPSDTTRQGLFESRLLNLAGELAPLPQQGVLSRRRLQAKNAKSTASPSAK